MSDPIQFEVFMRNYQNMVFTTAYRLLGSQADAEDIAQETFLRAWRHFPELEHSPAAPGWLRTVARNLSLNHLSRYRARWRFFSELAPSTDDDRPDFAANLTADPDSQAPTEESDRRQLLEAALNRLPAAQRVPLVLYHFEQLSYEEIAQRLGISLGKLKTDIHRGRETLRRRLALNPELAPT